MLCLVVEYESGGEFPPFTQQHRGATVDLMAEPADPHDPEHHRSRLLVLIRNAPWPAIEALVADLAERRKPLTTLRAEPGEALWFGRATYDVATLKSPGTKVIVGLLDLIGPPWVHVESGVVHLRARLRDPAQAEEVLQLASEGLKAAGVEAQAVVQEISPKDHSVWESLVRHSIGMSL